MPKKKDLHYVELELDSTRLDTLYQKVKGVIERARGNVYKTVSFETLKGNWEIGRYIVEDEQHGKARATKGDALVKNLAKKLTLEYGSGFEYSHIRRTKKFYLTFPKGDALRAELTWTHYRYLITIDDEKARLFYMNEAIQGCWGTRTLERAILTKLYERTLLAQENKQAITELAQDTKKNEGEGDYTPKDFIKEPYNLAFTGLKSDAKIYEEDLEQALMDKLQEFIMELGRGFAFVARQRKITIEDENYYTDLVFYHCILKCYVIIELKVGKITPKDIGQLDFYVNYWDEEEIQPDDNPTIGLILGTDKSNAVVRYTQVAKNEKLFAAKYQLYLPSEDELKKRLLEEKERIEQEQRLNKEEDLM